MVHFVSVPKLSIALVTRNRAEQLNCCLESVRSQKIQPWEIVVSDDSTEEESFKTAQVAQKWGCRYLRGPRQGLYANRNFAALACQGSHVRTMDDDHILPPGHLELCEAAIAIDPEAIWTTGEVGFVNQQFSGEAATAQQLCPAGVGAMVTDLDDNWAIADGSTIYPRVIFEQGYRLLEDYRYGSSYLEFGAYLYYRGFRSRCIRGAYVEHYADCTTVNRYDSEAVESWFFASLCYNLYFKVNYALAIKYIAAYSWRLRRVRRPRKILQNLLQRAKKRWQD
ncbi:MAG: glycosyltransferase family 2 protein [Jaaginema sp. PMC 1079.18]|nr:glycosyltransferase family 2 protein [Jaaginema sp. PMC 1080.18]MEC4852155.1 glycosyltransferase family 2 protein [Jaaginema sp. PMC 1079.18]MEC4867499.1 glycosyltransferase family 2 protein [Jaaginema sp. PMC 1078.18]